MANKKTQMKRQRKQNRSQKKRDRKQSRGRKQIMRGGGKYEIQWQYQNGDVYRTQEFDTREELEEKMKEERRYFYSSYKESFSDLGGGKIYTIHQIGFGQ